MIKTTLTIDDDLIRTTAEISAISGKGLAEVVSEVIRQTLNADLPEVELVYDDVLGVAILPTIDFHRPMNIVDINYLRDDEE